MNRSLSTSVVDIGRKRKLLAEQVDLPIPKHVCQDRTSSSAKLIINEKFVAGNQADVTQHESAKDSNSFEEDSDCAMSEYDGCELKSSTWSLSGSTGYDDSSTFKNTPRSSDCSTAMIAGAGEGELAFDGAERHEFEDSDEFFLEYKNGLEYIYSQCEGDGKDQDMVKDLEDVPFPSRGNPNIYVLSSGRWTVNPEAEQQTRKPTIDQEFEQYFSMLML